MRHRKTHHLITMTGSLAGLLLATTMSATSPTSYEDELLRKATLAFEHAVQPPRGAIPAPVLIGATAIAIIPARVTDGTRVQGDGVVSARTAGDDYWTPPAIVAFDGEMPLDIENGPAELILVAQTQRGLDYFLQGQIRGTTTHAIIAGPLGHDTPVRIKADVLAYMKFGNHVAGVTFDDWSLRDVTASNAVLYGRAYSTADIFSVAGFFHIRGPVRTWRNTLAAYIREMS